MSKGKKAALIIAIILVAVGLIMCVASMVVTGGSLVDKVWDVAIDIKNGDFHLGDNDDDYNELVPRDAVVAGPGLFSFDEKSVKAIHISAVSDDVEIMPDLSGDSVVVEAPLFEGGYGYTAELSGDTLEIDYYQNETFSVDTVSDDSFLKLWIPASLMGAVDISIDIVSGDTELTDITGGKLAVTAISGDITLERCDFNAIICDTTGGEVDALLLGTAADHTVTANTVSGKLEAITGGTGAKTVDIHTVSGDIELEYAK